jgi:antitoxin (DNA-binding transcriptional repressor) of toxin-antitoxin stability system
MSDEPTTRTISISDIVAELPGLIDGVTRHETQIVVEQDGEPIAALIAFDDFQRILRSKLDQEWEETTRSLERVSEAFADVPVEELEARIEEIISEGRRRHVSEYRSA